MNHMRENELIQWGTQVGTEIRPPVFIFLKGPLGSGKSVLARSIALGMGVEGAVASPTFNLLLTYPSPRGFQFVHLDLYRLNGPEDLWELGWEELGDRDQVVIVEWPERAGVFLPDDRWEIELDFVEEDEAVRTILVEKYGDPATIPDLPNALNL